MFNLLLTNSYSIHFTHVCSQTIEYFYQSYSHGEEIDRFRGIGPHTFAQQILNVASNVSIIITPSRHEMTLYALFYLNQTFSHCQWKKIYYVVKVGQMCSVSYWIFLVRLYCIQIATTIFVLKHLKFVKKFSVSNAMWEQNNMLRLSVEWVFELVIRGTKICTVQE